MSRILVVWCLLPEGGALANPRAAFTGTPEGWSEFGVFPRARRRSALPRKISKARETESVPETDTGG